MPIVFFVHYSSKRLIGSTRQREPNFLVPQTDFTAALLVYRTDGGTLCPGFQFDVLHINHHWRGDDMLKSVLLVEDEMFVGIESQISFEEDGWEVDGPYATAAQAIAALETDKPACAVLDVGLIDADVFKAAERLTSLDIPFLFYTGQPNIDELGVRFPDAPTITKPALPSYVIEAAHGLVSQRSSL